ncbi:MAG: Xaa-Pro aminopeptidase [Chlamydiales bacterium]|jgi:Xaa-Pro aminopeptidase
MHTLFVASLSLLSATPVTPGALAREWDQGYEVNGKLAVLPHRERADAVNRILGDRLDNLLPRLMRETGIDMWLVINREYAEDPVYLTLVPEPAFAARRTTILMFFDRGEEQGIERLTISRYGLGEYFESGWEEGGSDAEQWARLAQLIAERDPVRIGVNTSDHWAFGDGLSSGLRKRLEHALGSALTARLTPAEDLCIRWMETRSELEMQVYPQLVQLARSVISEAFSNEVITPGVTTTDDVAWYIRQRYSDLGLSVWFQPYCNVQRRGDVAGEGDAFFGESHGVIERGDVLHTDVGIKYLRLNTDTQEMGYVLHVGEEDVPEGLKRALTIGNRWQDLLTQSFVAGRTGNEILAAAREASAAEDIQCSVYTHPLGYHGHAAGPTIGMWDNQGPTPVRGEWTLSPGTCYAIEGNVVVPIPEWDGQLVQVKLEQDGWFDGERVVYIGGRQTKWHVVR